MALFRDREDAAARLIEMLPPDIGPGWIVLGLPRGGLPIAARIARHLGTTLDVLVVRKVGAPDNPELALATVTGPGPQNIVINEKVRRALRLSPDQVRDRAASAVAEVARRRALWAPARPAVALAGRDVLIVDDGAATGTTLAAAIQAARAQGARKIAVAIPVALGGALDRVTDAEVALICPYPDQTFGAVGLAYDQFGQVDEDRVRALLNDANREPQGSGADNKSTQSKS